MSVSLTSQTPELTARKPDAALQSIIKVAILAVGGQGGGVLTNWIETLARSQNYATQATSVAGVAQRTGATIYYIEMAPIGSAPPVFSLAPTSGDVDIMIAAELMEAGRAIMRGFVTPDRTTLIASTHRALAVSEKMVPGDGISNPEDVYEAARLASDQLIMFDLDKLATQNGSVISSSLFGALAGSGALPFPREAFEEAIRGSGKGVEASLRAFSAAFDRAQGSKGGAALQPTSEGADAQVPTAQAAPVAQGPNRLLRQWDDLETRAQSFHQMAVAGLRKVVGFQDLAYGQEYLDRVAKFAPKGQEHPALLEAAAKYIANAMCYDDIIRVADLKTRKARFDRIKADVASQERPLHLTEFFHPRGEEIISMLPARVGAYIVQRPRLAGWIDRRLNKGRRVRTDRLSGFVTLYFLAGLRRTRRISLRHKDEVAHIDRWMEKCLKLAQTDPQAAVELLSCQRLIKGYSDTHARGQSKFARVMEASALVLGRADASDWIARLREAALRDEKGQELDGAIKTIQSFAS